MIHQFEYVKLCNVMQMLKTCTGDWKWLTGASRVTDVGLALLH